jgi:LEA14-like dessication related protein
MEKMERIRNISIIAIVLIVFSGLIIFIYINDTSNFDNIDVQIENVSIKNLKLSSCELELSVKISNPSSETISDLTAEFNVFISNIDVGDGIVNKVTIPPKSYENSEVTLIIIYSDVGQAVINGIKTANFDLSIRGEAKLSVLFNLITITEPFSATYSYNS